MVHVTDADRGTPEFWAALRHGLDHHHFRLSTPEETIEVPLSAVTVLSCDAAVLDQAVPSWIIDWFPLHIRSRGLDTLPGADHDNPKCSITDVDVPSGTDVLVAGARARAARRWQDSVGNADVGAQRLRRGETHPHATAHLGAWRDQGRISGRGETGVRRLAWTLADLDCADRLDALHVGEALSWAPIAVTGDDARRRVT